MQGIRVGYTTQQKIAILWIYHSNILMYDKAEKTSKYNDNFIELALEKVRTTFDINIPLSTVRQWDVAQILNNPPDKRNKKRDKRPLQITYQDTTLPPQMITELT